MSFGSYLKFATKGCLTAGCVSVIVFVIATIVIANLVVTCCHDKYNEYESEKTAAVEAAGTDADLYCVDVVEDSVE